MAPETNAPEAGSAPAAQTFIVQGTLRLDNVLYAHGSEISLSDPERIAELRAANAIALPTEVLPPQQVADQLAAAQQEITTLREKLAALESAGQPAPKSGE